MVAVITGNGLGLGNTSLTQLGQSQGGSPSLGQAGSGYVNAATGNLVLQSADEGMLFDGLPLNVLRTHNSLGQLSSNGWSYGFSRNIHGLTGTLNTAGSTITRTDDDGSSFVYSYNAALGVYQSTNQSGAIDTLSWNATSSTWTWTDAASHTQETYNATGQLSALTDTASGASYSFSYSNGLLSQITAADGDTRIKREAVLRAVRFARGKHVKRWVSGMLLVLLACTVLASASPNREVAKRSMLLTGWIDVLPDGSVRAYGLDPSVLVPEALRKFVDKKVAGWKFRFNKPVAPFSMN